MEIHLGDIPEIDSAAFAYENSGKRANEAPAWRIEWTGEPILRTYAAWCRPIGKTFSPPFAPEWDPQLERSVAVMYMTPDGEKIWWHHMLPEKEQE